MSHCLIGVELGLQLVRWVVSSLLQSAWQASRRDRLVEAADAHAAPDGLPVTKPAGRPPCARQQGVAFSAMRQVVERVSTGEPTLLPRYGALGSALSYDLYNVVNGALAGRFEDSLSRLCYEDPSRIRAAPTAVGHLGTGRRARVFGARDLKQLNGREAPAAMCPPAAHRHRSAPAPTCHPKHLAGVIAAVATGRS